MSIRHDIALTVTYGLGATARTLVPRHALVGCTVRAAIETAIKAPQVPGSPEERAAIVIGEALRSGRQLDIELCQGRSGTPGRPVALDDVLDGMVGGEDRDDSAERTAMEQELNFSLTEPYRGGARR